MQLGGRGEGGLNADWLGGPEQGMQSWTTTETRVPHQAAVTRPRDGFQVLGNQFHLATASHHQQTLPNREHRSLTREHNV